MKKQAPIQFFYNNAKVSTLKTGTLEARLFCTSKLFLAELHSKHTNAHLIATDDNGSALIVDRVDDEQTNNYSAYGYIRASASLLGFNGEYLDHFLGNYILGSYRAFNTGLMRFQSPDNYSPFNEGGINAYAYCQGDPINKTDPSGHMGLWKLLAGGYSRATLSSRYESVKKPIRTLAEAKHRSLSESEYKATSTIVEREHEHFTRKVKKYQVVNAPNYGQKVVPGNTNREKEKLAYYEERLHNISEIKSELYDLIVGSVDTRSRYFTKSNHEIYLKLLTKKSSNTPPQTPRLMRNVRET